MSADETADLDALQLVCPITAELFEDPVLLVEDGYTYERSAVTAWLEKHDTSPMSGATLTTRTLAPNIRARQQADAARGASRPPKPRGTTRSRGSANRLLLKTTNDHDPRRYPGVVVFLPSISMARTRVRQIRQTHLQT